RGEHRRSQDSPGRMTATRQRAAGPGAGLPRLAATLGLLALLAACASAPPPAPDPEPAPPAPAGAPPVPAPLPRTAARAISIAAVGDIMLGTDYPENHLPDDDGVSFLADVTPIQD